MDINQRKANNWFRANFILRDSSQGWYALNCPYCDAYRDKMKGAVRFEWNRYKCWSCGETRSIPDFIADREDVDFTGAMRILEGCSETELPELDFKIVYQGIIKLPEHFMPIMSGKGMLAERARNYVGNNRGIDLKYAEQLGLGYVKEPESKYFGCIIIPFFVQGKLKYFIARNYILADPVLKYINPTVEEVKGMGKADLFFNQDAMYLYRTVELLEGAIDAMTLGNKGVSGQGWKLSENQLSTIVESPVENVVIIPDLGEDGKGVTFYEHAHRTALDLVEHKNTYIVDLSPFESLGKDVNAIGKKNVRSLYRGLKPLRMEDLIDYLL